MTKSNVICTSRGRVRAREIGQCPLASGIDLESCVSGSNFWWSVGTLRRIGIADMTTGALANILLCKVEANLSQICYKFYLFGIYLLGAIRSQSYMQKHFKYRFLISSYFRVSGKPSG